MPIVDAVVETIVSRSIRCRQLETLFDVPPQEKQTLRWQGSVDFESRDWNVGLIVGPSGCGKTTIARSLFGDIHGGDFQWSGSAVIDDFPKDIPLEDIASICQAVGFNTIPAWMRPYAVLSNGEKFRVTLARLLAEQPQMSVLDEFTSVVDRQVAKIGSHAVQKYVRKRNSRFVAISCHSDIVEWLNPDWTFEPATMTFTWRSLQRRPAIECEIAKVHYDMWRVFAPYHYLTAQLHRAAQCYALFVNDEPAAFGAMLYRPISQPRTKTRMDVWGLSRLVTLPDYQGLGLAFVLTDTLGSAFAALGRRMHTYPAHPALMRAFDKSQNWQLILKPALRGYSQNPKLIRRSGVGSFGGRPNAVFHYVGEKMSDTAYASRLLSIRSLMKQEAVC